MYKNSTRNSVYKQLLVSSVDAQNPYQARSNGGGGGGGGRQPPPPNNLLIIILFFKIMQTFFKFKLY
jgi:hypothetical protein